MVKLCFLVLANLKHWLEFAILTFELRICDPLLIIYLLNKGFLNP